MDGRLTVGRRRKADRYHIDPPLIQGFLQTLIRPGVLYSFFFQKFLRLIHIEIADRPDLAVPAKLFVRINVDACNSSGSHDCNT